MTVKPSGIGFHRLSFILVFNGQRWFRRVLGQFCRGERDICAAEADRRGRVGEVAPGISRRPANGSICVARTVSGAAGVSMPAVWTR